MRDTVSRRRFLGHVSAVGALAGAGAVVPTASSRAHDRDAWPGEREWSDAEWAGSFDVFHHRAANPNPKHLIRRGRGWIVLPTGRDDHDNLEWALRNTASGGIVKLTPGIYKIGSPILVANFDGALVGAGASRTTITCTDEFSYEVWEAPGGGKQRGNPGPPPFVRLPAEASTTRGAPSPKERGEPRPRPFPRLPVEGSRTRGAPALILFYKTPLQAGENPANRANRIVISNLRCRGAMSGELWAFGDEVLCINIINSFDWHKPESAPATTRQDVLISGVEVDGYSTPAFGPFENACACITVLGGLVLTSNYDLNGDVDGDALGIANGGLLGVTPAEGNVTFRSCTFKNCRVGPGVVGYRDSLIIFDNVSTDGCRGNCLQILDVSNCRVLVRGNDLRCDSFILPPVLVGGATGVPSSLGCVAALQGLTAAIGFAANVRWHTLANDQAAHRRHPEAGPLGTWRPQGPSSAPRQSEYRIVDNSCESSVTSSTYCLHVIDVAKLAFGFSTVRALVYGNDCAGSETCIGLEHLDDVRVIHNQCDSQAFGIELHNSPGVRVADNSFEFTSGVAGCEVRILQLGEKIDFSRVLPGAGVCIPQ